MRCEGNHFVCTFGKFFSSVAFFVETIQLHVENLHPSIEQYLKELLVTGSFNTDNRFAEEAVRWLNLNFKPAYSLLTNSCTDALEMSGLILDLKEGDEVIVPAYTYVSTANAYCLRTRELRFADCLPNRPVVDLSTIEPLVTANTKAIVVMHYGGIAVEMNALVDFCKQHQIALIEDAAHAIGATYLGRPLGSYGDMGSISFHYTKPISCGEGGCILLNREKWISKANCIYEKGTNRKFYKEQQLSKYEWLDLGSSYAMSGIQACVLAAQLQSINEVITKRVKIWQTYMELLAPLCQKGHFQLPDVPEGNQINGSYFFIKLQEPDRRDDFIHFLKNASIESGFHYLALHRSPFYANKRNQFLPNADSFEASLIRLPIHTLLQPDQLEYITAIIDSYFGKQVV
ncbi:MAG: dTDP-4-amino-4,6-dideoxygalactose transaminase [Saprospiraceae bacterium]|nr:dTDP-4-amino-4,6-dideoxygalactose transaminase [Saprospiraceae bacterium]